MLFCKIKPLIRTLLLESTRARAEKRPRTLLAAEKQIEELVDERIVGRKRIA